MSDDVPCSVEGCDNLAARNGLCWGHEKRRSRDQRLGELRKRVDGKGPKARWARLEKCVLEFADDTERPLQAGESAGHAYAQAKWKLRDGLKRYIAELMPAVYRFKVDAKGRIKFTRRDGRPLNNPAKGARGSPRKPRR